MANGNRLYSLNDIITNDTSVRHNGRVIDITTRSIVGSPNFVYGNIFVPGILAKRRVNNAAAIEQTLHSGMTTFTMSHESGSPLCAEEIAVVTKKAADAVGSAPILTTLPPPVAQPSGRRLAKPQAGYKSPTVSLPSN